MKQSQPSDRSRKRAPIREGVVFGLLLVGIFSVAMFSSSHSDDAEDQLPDLSTLAGQWKALEKSDPDASRALLAMSGNAAEVIPFLHERLQPLKLAEGQAIVLLEDLNSNNGDVWEPAYETLDYLDPRLAIDLEGLMSHMTESPGRERLVALLSGRPANSLLGEEITLSSVGDDGYNFRSERGSWWAEHRIDRLITTGYGNRKAKWTRAIRAITLLEHFGTPEATAILERMTTGHPDAQPTKVAEEALKRLRNQSSQ